MAELLALFGFIVVLLRAAILCFQTIAVGGIIFRFVVMRGQQAGAHPAMTRPWPLIRWSALALALAQACFVVSNTVVLTASADISLGDALGANYVAAGALAIVAGLVVFFVPAPLFKSSNAWLLLPASGMIAASVMTSHAASRIDDRLMLVLFTTIHYIATAAWIGGLPYLLLMMRNIGDHDIVAQVARRFSRVAQVSVGLLFAAGVGLSVWYVGSWNAVYGTAYGLMVSTKLVFFAFLMVLGAANYRLVGSISKDSKDSRLKTNLLRFAEVEIGIGLTVILTAASLTSQPPGADLTRDRVTVRDITTRYAPRMPRFSSPAIKELSESSAQVSRRAQAEGRTVAFIPGSAGAGVSKPADIAWSEYNHNWAGVFVLLIGLLALLSRIRHFRWARMWPLVFLGLAVFLFVRSDPENWPLGPRGFWESFAAADVLQHRIAVAIVVLFAVFQWRVETHRVRSHLAALVFPSMCALGGVVLLTHTHALSNVKEELLIEYSHVPLAIFAVLAGWSRWLELRLPDSVYARKYMAWIWPVCFILIGIILLGYHEADVV